ncbi:MAG: hypothetical protein KDD36_09975 [Flavobacteriales bacterium]|nr:hypothetical protein [Flavobacteriales bacterium]
MKRAGMVFTPPDGLKPVSPIANDQMNWEAAYRHPRKKFEVRYAIRPMDHQLEEYETAEQNKKEGDVNIHPNKWFRQVFEMTVLNVSGGQLPDYAIFSSDAVKKEFNGDWGATVTIPPKGDFAGGYKFCLFVFIHKDDKGDGYVFYMADDKDLLLESMKPIFHSLKFLMD